jgi:hypothetical protein
VAVIVGVVDSEGETEADEVASGVGSSCSLRIDFFPQAGRSEATNKKTLRAKKVEFRKCRIAEIL